MSCITQKALGATDRNSFPIFRQSEIKGGALVELRLSPNAAAMALDDALDNGKADAGAFVFLPTVQTLEGAEQIADIAVIHEPSAHPKP
jgi:hypothetical protein